FDAQYLQLDAAKLEPSIWPGELDEGMWLTPQSALASHDAGNIFISYPVLETIRTIRAAHNDLPTAARAMEARGVNPPSGGEMLTGVHVLPLKSPTLPPATHTNVYTLGHHDVVIVDPAPTEAEPQEELIHYLTRLQASGVRLREIWLTHHHPDHVGSAMLVRDRFGIPIAAHEITASDLHGIVKVDRFIADGEVSRMPLIGDHFAEWTAIFTPGHARGHLCFFDTRMRTLLAGDLLASLGTIIVAPPDGDMRDYMASLAKVRALNPRLLFPAHGPPVGAIGKIDEYVAHRTARENAILEALRTASTAHDIVPLVYTDVPEATWPLAEINVQAVLDKLETEGRIRKSGHGYLRSSA
ncbi:MAG: MBL fold metallo-hydrolase, partial [Myxococcota bacterium]